MESFNWLTGFVFPCINFFLFMILLVRLAKKPLLGLLGAKRQEFLELLASAQQVRAEAEARLRELNQRLAGLDKELAQIKELARQEAEQEARIIVEKGREIASFTKEEACRLAHAELEKARSDIQAQILSAVRGQVEEKIRQDMTISEKEQYLRSQIGRLGSVAVRG